MRHGFGAVCTIHTRSGADVIGGLGSWRNIGPELAPRDNPLENSSLAHGAARAKGSKVGGKGGWYSGAPSCAGLGVPETK